MSSTDVEDIIQIVNVFSYFNRATEILSGSDYPTLSMVHPLFFKLLGQMTVYKTDKPLTKLLKNCLAHYTDFYMDKYITPKQGWYCAASFLDLRVRSFSNLNPKSQDVAQTKALELLNKLIADGPTEIKSLASIVNTQQTSNKKSTQTQLTQQTQATQGFTYKPPNFSVFDTDVLIPNQVRKNAAGSNTKFQCEIDKYLKEPMKDVDPIEFWKLNKTNYPGLFYCFEYIFSMMASSVPSESLFSEAGDQLPNKRNRLDPENLTT
jgi:hypothetical protein